MAVHEATSRGAKILAALVMLPLLATLALMVFEGWGFFDALWMAIITLTTVGYEEVHPLDASGRIIISVYLLVGLGVFLFGIVYFGEALLEVRLGELLGKRKMDAVIRSLEGHIIVCGYGRMGRSLCRQLRLSQRPFVVVDRDPDHIERARLDGIPSILGDATDDAILHEAGVERASGIAAVLPSDADNLFVVVSVRAANPKLQILARATEERNVAKIQRAGANRVVSPYETGAHKMAQLLVSPNLEDIMGIFTRHGDKFDVAEITVKPDAPFCGKALNETDLRERGVLVIGHARPGGEFQVPPPARARIESGDTLIVFGNTTAVVSLLGNG